MLSDLTYIFYWWLIIFGLGLAVLPLTLKLFNSFFDRGYPFAKILGILLLSYTVYVLGSFHILPFLPETIWLTILGLFIVNYLVISKNQHLKDLLKEKWPTFLLEEGLFFVGLAFWAYVRAHEPSIRGLEKFMDFGFINSGLRGLFFPPKDLWLPPETINYYYFGHLTGSVLTKLTGLDPAITYNLLLANIFGLTLSASFSIGANLVQAFLKEKETKLKILVAKFSRAAIVGGLLSAFLVTLGGNLHTMYAFTKGYPNEKPQPPWELLGQTNINGYWYPNATRFIPYTIHEFPSYSWVVADLHGHVWDIPFVLLTIALLLALTMKPLLPWKGGVSLGGSASFLPHSSPPSESEGRGILRREIKFQASSIKSQPLGLNNWNLGFIWNLEFGIWNLLPLGLLTAVCYMTNAWDGIIYLGLTGLVILVSYFNLGTQTNHSLKTQISSFCYQNKSKAQSLKNLAFGFCHLFVIWILIFGFFFLFSLPFNLHFHPFVNGIGVVKPQDRSPLYMPVILWGFFYFNVLGFLAFILIPNLKKGLTRLTNLTIPDILVSIFIFLSTLLLIFPEFFYVKDIYPLHYRANTMFKLGYQAFIMLSIASAYITIRLLKRLKETSGSPKISLFLYFSISLFLYFLVSIYPLFSINSYYGGLRVYRGLDGLAWLAETYPADYEGLKWLRQNTSGQPIIAEAVGESYTDYARISANTGLPTILGWPVHEWLWRGSYDPAGKRIPEVQTIYEGKTASEVLPILRKYNVSYIFLGSLERQKYPNLESTKFANLGELVFKEGQTEIYKVNQ